MRSTEEHQQHRLLRPGQRRHNCWRDWYSSQPLLWDFYRNATRNADQLRQRTAYALQQILVVKNNPTSRAPTPAAQLPQRTARQRLRQLPPAAQEGDGLAGDGRLPNNANNDKAPNENYARELLQLFSDRHLPAQPDGTLRMAPARHLQQRHGAQLRLRADRLDPPGRRRHRPGLLAEPANCQFYGGRHGGGGDTATRSRCWPGMSVRPAACRPGAGDGARQRDAAPEHRPIAKQLIQHPASRGKPQPGLRAARVAAFTAGSYSAGRVGAGQRGDPAATVAADPARCRGAREPTRSARRKKLREPALMFTAVLRALNGSDDGDALGWWWGETLRQHAFRPPSVFINFYPPDCRCRANPAYGRPAVRHPITQRGAGAAQNFSPTCLLGRLSWTARRARRLRHAHQHHARSRPTPPMMPPRLVDHRSSRCWPPQRGAATGARVAASSTVDAGLRLPQQRANWQANAPAGIHNLSYSPRRPSRWPPEGSLVCRSCNGSTTGEAPSAPTDATRLGAVRCTRRQRLPQGSLVGSVQDGFGNDGW